MGASPAGTSRKVLLVNPNRLTPPIAPLALDLLADSLIAAGFEPVLLDLAWSDDVERDIRSLDGERFLFAGVSIRNIDDSMYPGTTAILEGHRRVVGLLKLAGLEVVVGGIGLSIAPAQAATVLGADRAVAGDGEEAIVALARAYSGGEVLESVPGLVGRALRASAPLGAAPPLRSFVDNRRYFELGGQIGFETQRGCHHACAVCPEPQVKGREIRPKAPAAVAAELASLVERGIDVFHTCDSEFNAPRGHALAVCRQLADSGLGERLRWYAYCEPYQFDRELALEMRRAGCAGINFSAMHGDPGMLSRLRCPHGVDDLRRATEACREAGVRVMLDLLFGCPGETRGSIRAALELMRELSPTRVGVGLGCRLYDGCAITRDALLPENAASLHRKGPDDRLVWPTYYVESALGPDVAEWLGEQIGGDRRFFYGATIHNYNDNLDLGALVAAGARGAYWDVLARAAGD